MTKQETMQKMENKAYQTLDDDQLDAVTGGLDSKPVTMRSKWKIDGRTFDVEKKDDGIVKKEKSENKPLLKAIRILPLD